MNGVVDGRNEDVRVEKPATTWSCKDYSIMKWKQRRKWYKVVFDREDVMRRIERKRNKIG